MRKTETAKVPRVAFVQPFGLADEGGGPKVLNSLLKHAPIDVVSVNTVIGIAKPTDLVREIHLARRPSMGRIERTRLNRLINSSNRLFGSRFRRRLTRLLKDEAASAVHAIAHSWDCFDAFEVAKDLHLPFILTVHDDLLYALKDQSGLAEADVLLKDMWRQSDLCFVISEEIGQEYCHRYGDRQYLVVTDGLNAVAELPRTRPVATLSVYFMGLLHQSYLPNFRLLVSALDEVAREHPEWDVSLTTRCGSNGLIASTQRVKVNELPFVQKNPTADDMRSANVTYLPLPFEESEKAFTRYSLSTKMIGYLGSGLPILYHGPDYSAAHGLLTSQDAAQVVTKPDSRSLVEGLYVLLENYEVLALAGLKLARDRFLLPEIRSRFWNAVAGVVDSP